MKLMCLLLFAFLIQFKSFAQPTTIEWQKCYGGSNFDENSNVQSTNDGGYVLSGTTFSNNYDVTSNNGAYDYWITKLNSLGVIQWQKTFGGTNSDVAKCIRQTLDSGYIVTGYSLSNNGDVTNNHGQHDFWIIKLNDLGEIQWKKTYGGTYSDASYDIQQTTDGGYIATGYTSSSNGDITYNHGQEDVWVIKLNNLGEIQWQKTYGGSSSEIAYSIILTLDGKYILAGTTGSTNGDVVGNHGFSNDYWILKLDNLGNIEWQKAYGGSSGEIAKKIISTIDGGYIIVGTSTSNDGNLINNYGSTDFWVVKINNNGNLEWQKSYGGSNADYAEGLIQENDGSYIVAGYTFSNNFNVNSNNGGYDYWIIKLNSAGNLIWEKTYGGSNDEAISDILKTIDGGIVLTGTSYSSNGDVTFNHGNGDFWVVKLSNESLEDYSFYKNDIKFYPNPVSDKITFESFLKLPETVKIYDQIGKCISLNVNNKIVDTSSLKTGIYFLEIETEKDKSFFKKFIKF